MVIPSSSDKPETLNELTRLRDSEFGQPHPRHGLRLLYWLACECISYDDSLATLLYMPDRGDYGFHYFKNRENILPSPKEEYFYYEVGNLNKPNAQALPSYIRVNYNSNCADSNSDRVILSVGPCNIIDRIYVTEHQGKGSFDRERTYRISKGLMNVIKNLELSAFLNKMGEDPNIRQTNQAYTPSTVSNVASPSQTPDHVTIPVPESPRRDHVTIPVPESPRRDHVSIPVPEPRSQPQRSTGFWDYCTIL
ncbi:uncharacterized protein LOC118227944 [Anguilla anguilla]|uniref:uncharacterized protein LOC118227944 n=1 Tax=Anguilla anguilla TaxID=7936 RepID=UPI0015B05337|nr:uncharacterized protein LOC118227944 [Anguilla anguilla]